MSVIGAQGNDTQGWDIVVRPKRSVFRIDLADLWRYRDLIALLVRRDVVAVYKQTVLGPLWHIIQPLTTTITFTIIFGMVARLAPPDVPPVLFYMSGIVSWNYFAGVVNRTSKTFIGNAQLMSKVYFPRLVVPISSTLSSLVSFAIQFVTLLGFIAWYHFTSDTFHWRPGLQLMYFPLLVILMSLLGLGTGIIVSALTTKYRDLQFLVGFGIQLLMYASPVIFPLELVADKPKLLALLKLNPMTPVIASTRDMLFGAPIDWGGMAYTAGATGLLLLVGVVLFQRVERSFSDIV